MGRETAGKTIAQNRKAFHDYFVEERFEAGISLAGTEVKSIRAGKVNLKDCFCTVEDGQLVVIGMHISPYEQGNIFNKDPLRKRVLLMHKKEIMRLFGKVKQVYAVGQKNAVGCWNHVASSLTFENGVQATAEGIIEMPKGFPFTMELNVVGDKKSVSYRMRAGTNLEDVASAVRETWLYGGDEPQLLDIDPFDAYQRELEDFIGHIEAGTPITSITPEDVRHVLSVILAIRTSLETGQTVAL